MKESGNRRKNREHRETKITVEGILTGAEWDETGAITRIRLLATDEEEYAVENGESFLNLARKYVRVSGAARFSRRGGKTLWIRKCTILDPPSDDGFSAAESAWADRENPWIPYPKQGRSE